MGASTGIAWTDSTFNIAHGCFKVSPGCKFCYAEEVTQRRYDKTIWGPTGSTERRVFGEKHWNEPLKWNRQAQKAGLRHRVFSSSMCDIFEDHPTIIGELSRLWPLIRATPWLDWQLLTKRFDRIERSLPDDWGPTGYDNVWLGVSVENQQWANQRIPFLLRVPARVHWVSYEPALGPVMFGGWLGPVGSGKISWVIYGGESGPHYRPEDKQWARNAMAACEKYGAAFFHKQSAARLTETGIELDGQIVRNYPLERKPHEGFMLH